MEKKLTLNDEGMTRPDGVLWMQDGISWETVQD